MKEQVREFGEQNEGEDLQRCLIHKPKDILPENPEIRKEIIVKPDFINHLLQIFLWKQVFRKNFHLPFFETTVLPLGD